MKSLHAQFKIQDHYDKRKNPRMLLVRRMTVAEAKCLSAGSHALAESNSNTAVTVKINGKPKTWKRNNGRVEVPLKYGMYEYTTDTGYFGEESDIKDTMKVLLVAVG